MQISFLSPPPQCHPNVPWRDLERGRCCYLTHTKDCTVTKALSQGFDPCHQISAPTSVVAFTLNVCVNGLWPAG